MLQPPLRLNRYESDHPIDVYREHLWCYQRVRYTMLSTLTTLKFVHLKVQKKYEWTEHARIYHNTKSEMQVKFLQ